MEGWNTCGKKGLIGVEVKLIEEEELIKRVRVLEKVCLVVNSVVEACWF